MTISTLAHTVCPHCKRPVAARPEQPRAECPEHGLVVPMRSAVVNWLPAPPTDPTPAPA